MATATASVSTVTSIAPSDVAALAAIVSQTEKQTDKDVKSEKTEKTEEKKEISFETKINNVIEATQSFADDFAKETFGKNIPLSSGWAKRSTFYQRLCMAFTKVNDYAKKCKTENLGDKIFGAIYMTELFKFAKVLEELNNVHNSMPEPLQRLLNKMPEEHYEVECSCSSGKEAWRECGAHVFQVPNGIKPTMPNGIIEPHVIADLLVLSIENFLFQLSRPERNQDDLKRSDFNIMKSSDKNTNWHGKALSQYPGDENVLGYATVFDKLVELHNVLAGDEKTPSVHKQIKSAFDKAVSARSEFIKSRKQENAHKASTRTGRQGRFVKLGF